MIKRTRLPSSSEYYRATTNDHKTKEFLRQNIANFKFCLFYSIWEKGDYAERSLAHS